MTSLPDESPDGSMMDLIEGRETARLKQLKDALQNGKESLNEVNNEIQRLLSKPLESAIKTVEECESQYLYSTKLDLQVHEYLKVQMGETEQLQTRLDEALEGMKKVEGQLTDALAKEVILTKKLQELQTEKAKVETMRDALLPSAGQLVVALTKKRKWKQLSTSTAERAAEEHALLRNSLEETHRELKKEQEKSMCDICFAKPKDALLLPCRHLHFCHQCVDESLKNDKAQCPSCCSDVSEVLKCKIVT